METFLFLLELAGTVAFAVSGAVLGIEKHMDIFGVGLLGITTAVGGGILRDLVVGLTPPRAFQDPIYLLVALGVSVVLFFPFVRRIIGRSKRVFDALMLIMDAAGLGIHPPSRILQSCIHRRSHKQTSLLIPFLHSPEIGRASCRERV